MKARYLVADNSATYFGEAIALKAVGLSDSRFLFLKSRFNLKKFYVQGNFSWSVDMTE